MKVKQNEGRRNQINSKCINHVLTLEFVVCQFSSFSELIGIMERHVGASNNDPRGNLALNYKHSIATTQLIFRCKGISLEIVCPPRYQVRIMV